MKLSLLTIAMFFFHSNLIADTIPSSLSGLSLEMSHDFPSSSDHHISNYSIRCGYFYQLYKSQRSNIVINPHLSFSQYQTSLDTYLSRDTFNVVIDGGISNQEINISCDVSFSYQIFNNIPLEGFVGLSLGLNLWNQAEASYTETIKSFRSFDIIEMNNFDNIEIERSRFVSQFPYLGLSYRLYRVQVQLIFSSGTVRIVGNDHIKSLTKHSFSLRVLAPL